MEANVKKLEQVCNELSGIVIGLMNGSVKFSSDNLSNLKVPMNLYDILDDIILKIYFTVSSGKEPSMEKLKDTLEELNEFKDTFEIKEMEKPLQDIKEYIHARESSCD